MGWPLPLPLPLPKHLSMKAYGVPGYKPPCFVNNDTRQRWTVKFIFWPIHLFGRDLDRGWVSTTICLDTTKISGSLKCSYRRSVNVKLGLCADSHPRIIQSYTSQYVHSHVSIVQNMHLKMSLLCTCIDHKLAAVSEIWKECTTNIIYITNSTQKRNEHLITKHNVFWIHILS